MIGDSFLSFSLHWGISPRMGTLRASSRSLRVRTLVSNVFCNQKNIIGIAPPIRMAANKITIVLGATGLLLPDAGSIIRALLSVIACVLSLIHILEDMQKSEQLVIEALAFIRGRSLSETYCIIDEAQNLTPHEIKTIITRAGEGTKMVFTGDIQQIDQPYLDSQSNGLVYMIDRMKEQNIFAHVNLVKMCIRDRYNGCP